MAGMIGNRLPDRIWIPQPTTTTLEWPELVEYQRVYPESAVIAHIGRQAMRDASALLRDVMIGHADPEDACYNECDHEMCGWCRDALKTIFTLDAATGDKK